MTQEHIFRYASDIEAKPVESFGQIVFNTTLDTGIDLLEVGLDQLLEDGLIREIPIIGVAYTTSKLFISLKDAMLTKKALVFAQRVQAGTADKKTLEKHREKLNKKPKKLMKELEALLVHLDKHTTYLKNKILGNFYILYLDEDIDFSWDDFEYMAEIVDNISVFDLEDLSLIYKTKTILEGEKYNSLAMKRLRYCGLVDFYDGMVAARISEATGYIAKITKLGELFWEKGMKGLSNKITIQGEEIIL